MFAWVHSGLRPPKHKLLQPFWQRLEVGYLVVYNVYLDAYDQVTRAAQLDLLRKGALAEGDQPTLVLGDFNIAPTPTEGLFDRYPSRFNSETDRVPLRELLDSSHLIDLGATAHPLEWTIERERRGKRVQFRCDLALASDYLALDLKLNYDHSSRVGPDAFTDHSALLISAPVTIPQAEHQLTLFASEPHSSTPVSAIKMSPEKTAIHRKEPTPIARKLTYLIDSLSLGKSVLDYGCGYGEDVRFYRAAGLRAEGYDPHPPFGWSIKPKGPFDVVTLIFVLNVLPDPWIRWKTLSEATTYLSRDGFMVVVARSPGAINREAAKKNWPKLNDGYWSHEGKGTFQRGLRREDILALATRAGLTLSHYDDSFSPPPDATCVVLQRMQ